MWPDRRLIDLLGIEHPIIQAPMAGAVTPELAAAVANAGGLGSLAFAMSTPEQARAEVARMRSLTNKGFNVNYFCHEPPADGKAADAKWRARLADYFSELGIDGSAPSTAPQRLPFGPAACDFVCEVRPKVVSFHFGLPDRVLVDRVKAAGIVVLSSATTVAEARYLEEHGCDAVIAQGYEAGGHRGMFLTDRIASQVGTLALVPQVVDAVKVPVIAAGGIADHRGILAALALGAAGVQMGTAFLQSPEAKVSALHRAALAGSTDDATALTNVFTGRPARGIVNRVVRDVGPIAHEAPPFPLAADAIGLLRAAAEPRGSSDFTPLWSGQAGPLGKPEPAGDLVRRLAAQTLQHLGG